MMESPFGPSGAPWTGMSAPAFGWPIAPGNRPFANGITFGIAPVPGVATAPGLSRGAVAGGFPVVPPDVYAVAPLPAPFPPDLFGGYNIPMLLAAVAIRRGQPLGPTNDQEIEEFVYDALEMLPATNEVEVRCEGGRVTLTGSVQHKRIKREVGEIAWAIPIVNDVQNNVTIATKRRARPAQRESEPQQAASGRKQG